MEKRRFAGHESQFETEQDERYEIIDVTIENSSVDDNDATDIHSTKIDDRTYYRA